MSVDSQTGVGVVAGASTTGVAVLANTGVPLFVPIVLGALLVVLVALLTRRLQKN